jgi:hypothetical protein
MATQGRRGDGEVGLRQLDTSIVATVSAVIAALAALIALGFAWLLLKEARSTIAALQAVRAAAEAETKAQAKILSSLQTLAQDTGDTARLIHRLLAEMQAGRELEQLRRIASVVADLQIMGLRVRSGVISPDWHAISSSQDLLKAFLAALPDDQLPKCRQMVVSNPTVGTQIEADAMIEVQAATAEARKRLASAGT